MTKRVRDTTLREVADKLNFEPHRLRLDQSGRYDETLDHEFPFLIKLFRFSHNDFTPIHSWHERLELFMPLDGSVSMLMGERRVDIGPGRTPDCRKHEIAQDTGYPGAEHSGRSHQFHV